MIVVTGCVVARPDTVDEILARSLEHVHRSRQEPGCLLHTVHRDVEDPLRIVFLEHWSDRTAVMNHFAVAASAQFVADVTPLAAQPPEIAVYDVMPL